MSTVLTLAPLPGRLPTLRRSAPPADGPHRHADQPREAELAPRADEEPADDSVVGELSVVSADSTRTKFASRDDAIRASHEAARAGSRLRRLVAALLDLLSARGTRLRPRAPRGSR